MTPVRFGRPAPTSDVGSPADAPQVHPAPTTDALPALDAGREAASAAEPAGAEPPLTLRQQRVNEAVDAWAGRLLELGGESALADITQLGSASIDLTAAHPSGIAQLFAGRQTLLSNLVRETAALASARRRARTVLARADELAQRFGVAPTYLAIGIASWTSYEPSHDAGLEGGQGEPGFGGEPGFAGESGFPGDDDSGLGEDAGPGVPVPVALDADVPVALSDSADAPAGLRRRLVKAPILLRPVRLSARSETDVDVVLEPSVEVNPVLVRALRAAGSTLDVAELARQTLTEHGFSPRAALRRLRDEGEGALTNFRFAEHLVLGPFVHPGQVLVEDLEGRRRELAEHDVVAALAGDPDARRSVRHALPPFVAGDRPPAQERGVGDLDPSQQHAIDAVASGAHLFIDAPPGADVAATLAGILADAAAAGRHVLYVSGTRRAGQGLRQAMGAAGLEGLLLDLSADARWRPGAGARLVAGAAMSAPPVDEAVETRTRVALVEARAQMSAYITSLHTRRPAWGVSAYDALQALGALTSRRVSPCTTVRLDSATVRALSGNERETASATLLRAAELGAFSLRPEDTPWYGAGLTDPAGAREAVNRVCRLGEQTLPALRRRAADVAAQTGLERADRLRIWGDQLELLQGVHAALDTFLPAVFERSVDDLVAATASRQWRAANGIEMGWFTRRRLRKAAKELLRPGRGVADLHSALASVHGQRETWRQHSHPGTSPRVPDSLLEAVAEYRAVVEDLAALEQVLATTPEGADLSGALIVDLEARMGRLADGVAALDGLPERTRVLDSLRGLGLGPLVADLAERAVPAEMVKPELELAWWSSVFEEILRADVALAGYDGETLGALADQLRALDLEQLDTLPGPVLHSVVQRRHEALLSTSTPTRELLRDLANERVRDVREAVNSLGDLAARLRPCWLVAPMQVPQLLDSGRTVDLVVLDAAQHLPVEQAIPAISRGAQVVVVGDSRRAALNAEGAPQRIVDALAGVLPSVTLNADRVVREPALMAFLGEHGYADVIRSIPTPQTRSALRLEVVDGFGMPAPGSAVVESVQSEVDRVVDLVIEHALTRPDESLVVLTISVRHADRVREAVRSAIADSPAVRGFFARNRSEPFAVLELDSAAGVRRDAVVLSLGLGKTPHGRVMHRFGRISEPDGAGLLIDAIDACRRRLTVVSCFAPGELDRWRLRTPGPLLLADLLEAAEAGGTLAASVPGEGEPDRLLVDLAERLSQLGLAVTSRYGVPGGVRIPLVIGHPAQPDELLLAVLTDDTEYVGQASLRIRDRHDVQRLADRGWGVYMAFSTAVFLDPQAEAANVLEAVRRVLRQRRAEPLEFHPLPPSVPSWQASQAEADDAAEADAAAEADDAAEAARAEAAVVNGNEAAGVGVAGVEVAGVGVAGLEAAEVGGVEAVEVAGVEVGSANEVGSIGGDVPAGVDEIEVEVEAEFTEMAAELAQLEAALSEMESEFDEPVASAGSTEAGAVLDEVIPAFGPEAASAEAVEAGFEVAGFEVPGVEVEAELAETELAETELVETEPAETETAETETDEAAGTLLEQNEAAGAGPADDDDAEAEAAQEGTGAPGGAPAATPANTNVGSPHIENTSISSVHGPAGEPSAEVAEGATPQEAEGADGDYRTPVVVVPVLDDEEFAGNDDEDELLDVAALELAAAERAATRSADADADADADEVSAPSPGGSS